MLTSKALNSLIWLDDLSNALYLHYKLLSLIVAEAQTQYHAT